jgi:hypothetical protein
MIKNIDGLNALTSKLIAEATKNNEQGPHTFRTRVNGNWEPIDNEVKESMKTLFSGSLMMLSDLYVIFNGEHTIIETVCYDVRHVLSYVKELETKVKALERPEYAIKALSKAIIILDDYNNRYGSEHWNRTKEITELDETLKLLKD